MAEWAFVHDDRATTAERLERVLRERIRPATHRAVGRLEVAAWHVAGEPVPPAEALRADYAPFALGEAWGPPWGTTWFHLTGDVPASSTGDGLELLVDLGWTDRLPGFQAEGLVHRPDGTVGEGPQPAQRLDPGRAGPGRPLRRGGRQPDWSLGDAGFRPTRAATGDGGRRAALPAGARRRGRPGRRGLASWCTTSRSSTGLARAGAGRPARLGDPARARAGAGRARPRRRAGHRRRRARARSPASWPRPRTPARTGSPRSGTRTSTRPGCGRCARPCARWPGRSANVVDLLDADDDLVYAMSSAQQYAWLEEHRPDVFARVAAHVGPAGSCRSAGCGWSRTPTCPAARRWSASSSTASATSWRSSASTPRRCGCRTRSATRRPCRRSSGSPARAGS